MFPLEFPLRILRERAKSVESVLDPFCGRGTTNFAARLLGLDSLGVDSSPVATAITAAKLSRVTAAEILYEARDILVHTDARDIPTGEFWRWAYHPDALAELCQFRTAMLQNCTTERRVALRGIILGALHGPRQKTFQSYFSNQSPRTYAPKPSYAVRYWKERNILPLRVDVLDIIERRAKRYYDSLPDRGGKVRLGDSRDTQILMPDDDQKPFSWVITSPPYYGMNTYIPDQWLRSWFLGGPDQVDYTSKRQVTHSSPESFIRDLHKIWNNISKACASDAKMIIRFGGISGRHANPLELVKMSLQESAWRLSTVHSAGTAHRGKRQADSFLRKKSKPIVEFDLWAKLA